MRIEVGLRNERRSAARPCSNPQSEIRIPQSARLAPPRARLHDRGKIKGWLRVSEAMEGSVHVSETPAGRPACPVCSREAGEGLRPFGQLPDGLRELISANAPAGVQA